MMAVVPARSAVNVSPVVFLPSVRLPIGFSGQLKRAPLGGIADPVVDVGAARKVFLEKVKMAVPDVVRPAYGPGDFSDVTGG